MILTLTLIWFSLSFFEFMSVFGFVYVLFCFLNVLSQYLTIYRLYGLLDVITKMFFWICFFEYVMLLCTVYLFIFYVFYVFYVFWFLCLLSYIRYVIYVYYVFYNLCLVLWIFVLDLFQNWQLFYNMNTIIIGNKVWSNME